MNNNTAILTGPHPEQRLLPNSSVQLAIKFEVQPPAKQRLREGAVVDL